MDYLTAAHKFIQTHYPNCSFALVAGSVVRGEASITSDLDIVIINHGYEEATYRESFFEYGWPIEAFIFTLETYKEFMNKDVERRRPSLPKMISEGIVLQDKFDLEHTIRESANILLRKGPKPFAMQELLSMRYALTDMLDDLIGSTKRDEAVFIVNELLEKIINFILVNRGEWMGRGKWLPKLLKNIDEELYKEMMKVVNEFYKSDNKEPLIDFVEKELQKYGGRFFHGYRIGKGK